MYWSFDISRFLTPGTNAIGLMLGPGWRETAKFKPVWAPGPCDSHEVMARLVVLDAVSGATLVATDGAWQGTASGPGTVGWAGVVAGSSVFSPGCCPVPVDWLS